VGACQILFCFCKRLFPSQHRQIYESGAVFLKIDYIKIYFSCNFLHTEVIPLRCQHKRGWSTTMRRLGDGKYDNLQRLGGGGKGKGGDDGQRLVAAVEGAQSHGDGKG
jgi:hypothetical protein